MQRTPKRPLRDQVVVLTGATSGIGLEAARRFADTGARLVLAARSGRELDAVAADLRARGAQALPVPTDVRDPAAVEALAEAAISRFGRIDTWVNDAAVGLYATFEDARLDELRGVMETDYWGQVHALKAVLPRMKAQGGGTIICIGSLLSDFGVPLFSGYVAAKHAVAGLVEALRMELLHDRTPIDLVLLKPPSVDTPFYRHGRTRLGVEARAMPPVYDPIVIARQIVASAEHPRREVAISGLGRAAVWLHALAPGSFEHLASWYGYRALKSDRPKSPGAPNNLESPVADTPRTRDTGRGMKVSSLMWLEEHPKTAAAGALLAAAATTAWVARRR